MAVPPFPTPPPPPPPALSPVSPESVPAAPLAVSALTDGPRPPDSLTLHPSSDTPDEMSDEAEQNNRNRSSNSSSAPKSLRDTDTSRKRLKGTESPENELQAVGVPPEQQSCRSYSSSSKQTTAASPPLISPDLPTANRDPSCCAVVPGQETVLEICKGRSGLGLSIVGGRDTQLDAIVIHEVYEEGAAARDGRLWAGDQILEVNGVDLRGASHEEAIAALRQTPAKVRLTVLRDEAQYRDEENLDQFKVELQKKSGRGLGLSICARGPVSLEFGRLKAASWISSRHNSQGSQMSHVSGNSSGVVAPPLTQTPTSADAVTSDPPASTGPLLLNNNMKPPGDITSSPADSTGTDAGIRTVEITRVVADTNISAIASQVESLSSSSSLSANTDTHTAEPDLCSVVLIPVNISVLCRFFLL
eukprot:superscaffoldBa00002957_g15744